MHTKFSQNDPLWRDLKIPGTELTIAKAGCVVCAAAEIAVAAGKSETPATILPKLKFSKGLFVWQSLTDLYPDIVFKSRIENPNTKIIENWLEFGNPAIIKINVSSVDKVFMEHWKTIWSKEEIPDKIYAAALYDITPSRAPDITDLQIENETLQQTISDLKNKILRAREILA